MARVIRQESVQYNRTVEERSWRVELLTEIPKDELASFSAYPIVVHREHAELSDPSPPGGNVFYRGSIIPRGSAGRIPAEAGPVSPGQDGTDPGHYTAPVNPFFPTVRFTMDDIVNDTDEFDNPSTIDLKDSDGNVVMADFPLALVPSVITAGIEHMIDKQYAAEVAQKIALAVQAAQGL